MGDREFDKQVGQNVAAIRQGKGWTQNELLRRMQAKRPMGWWQQTVAKVESGARVIKFSEAVDLAAALEVDVQELFEPGEGIQVVQEVEKMVRDVETGLHEALRALEHVGISLARLRAYTREEVGEKNLPEIIMAKVKAFSHQSISKEAVQALAKGRDAWMGSYRQ